ncbi:MAG: hypothetical protein EHM27_13925, partial [Deltaproteobacteria bacterium]
FPGVSIFSAGAPWKRFRKSGAPGKKYYHNPIYTLIRPSHEEMRQVADTMARKLNAAKGPVRVILPLRGMSIGGLKGQSSYDPEGDQIFFTALKAGLAPGIPVYEIDGHVNEEPVAKKVVEEFFELVGWD